jgi:cob(I)alamin adenosyltransferase
MDMVRINKVYTKTGDGGDTALAGNVRVPKDSLRVETYGTVDELNCCVGLARTFNLRQPESLHRDKMEIILRSIQQRLFDIGSALATVPQSGRPPLKLTESNVEWLENVIDAMNEELGPLKSFTLPGGGPVPAFLHQARTVCRRAERLVVKLKREEEISAMILPYINRLSDALYVFSRWTTLVFKETEFLWEPVLDDPSDWKWK